MKPPIYINEIFLPQLSFPPQEPTSTNSSPTVIVANYLNEDVFLVSPDSTFESDMPPALIALNDNETTSDSGIDEANVLSRSGSTLDIAMNVSEYERMDKQTSSPNQDDPEKRPFRKRRHSALMAEEEKVMKNRGAEGPPTPPNVGSPFVSDAFLMEYNLTGDEYLNTDIEKFLE